MRYFGVNLQFFAVLINFHSFTYSTGCPTTYQTRHFFNNSKTNEDIATRFEQEYVRCVRNEEECVCSVCLFRCNIFIGFRIIKEIPGLVRSGTPYTISHEGIYSVLRNSGCKTLGLDSDIFAPRGPGFNPWAVRGGLLAEEVHIDEPSRA